MHENSLFYVVPFVVSMSIAVVLCLIIIWVHKKIHINDPRTELRHVHGQRKVSRFGGSAIIAAFMITLFLNRYLVFDHMIWALICGGVMIFCIGIIDDLKPLSWKSQIFFQIALVLTVFIFGIRIISITNPFGGVFLLLDHGFVISSLLFMIIWMIYIMNAVNWADGIDGLSGGVAFIAACALFMIALEPYVNQPPIAIIAIAFAGSVAGFLVFNFPKAQIFAGSSGSFFMGFVIAILAIAAGAKIGTTLLVLGVPLLDSLWVIICRVRAGRSIFYGDQEHLHFKLLHRGWSVKKILFLYYGVTILCAIAAIFTQSVNKLIIFGILCFVVIVSFGFLSYGDRTQKSI